MDNYTTITEYFEILIRTFAPGFKIPDPTWTLENENTVPGAYGGEDITWLRGKKDTGFYGTISISFDEAGQPEEKQALIWATGLPENLSVSIQSAPDFFNAETELLSLNLSAPAQQLSEILTIETENNDGFSFFKKLTKKSFPDFIIPEEPWQTIADPDPLDDSQSTEGTLVQVMGTEDSGFRRTVESRIDSDSNNEEAKETVIFTASGLPGETEIIMSTAITAKKEEQLFSLHITADENLFEEIFKLFTGEK